MADASRGPEDAHVREQRAAADATPGMPGWVKVFAVIGVVVIVVIVLALLVGGNHGPGRHFGAGINGGTPRAAFDAGRDYTLVGRRPAPVGGHVT